MQIFIGADHGGFELKQALLAYLQSQQLTYQDLGTFSEEACDYPVIATRVATQVQKNPQAFGILICRSGVGMCITANKFENIRAALVQTPESAKLAREHNHINVLCLAGKLDQSLANSIVQSFLTTPPDQAARHVRRLAMIHQIETEEHFSPTFL